MRVCGHVKRGSFAPGLAVCCFLGTQEKKKDEEPLDGDDSANAKEKKDKKKKVFDRCLSSF